MICLNCLAALWCVCFWYSNLTMVCLGMDFFVFFWFDIFCEHHPFCRLLNCGLPISPLFLQSLSSLSGALTFAGLSVLSSLSLNLPSYFPPHCLSKLESEWLLQIQFINSSFDCNMLLDIIISIIIFSLWKSLIGSFANPPHYLR